MENRYDHLLREQNQVLVNLTPGNQVLRIELALEIKKFVKNKEHIKILEIGSGEGDLTKYILEKNKSIKISCLDISNEMIKSSEKFLARFKERLSFINEDALSYLEKTKINYDIITSAWTIHNFKWVDKIKLFKVIYKNLSKNGIILIMDKFYPDLKNKSQDMLKIQLDRYRYLDPRLQKEISEHEEQDFLDEYRMEESQTLDLLKKIGFKNIKLLDRVERDVLLIAEK